MSSNHSREKAILNYLQSVILVEARRNLGQEEAAKDCVVIFLEQAFAMPEAQHWPISAEAAAAIAAAAHRCAETEARRLRRQRWRDGSSIDLYCPHLSATWMEPASPDLGPEQRTLLSNVVAHILTAVRRLPRRYRALFTAVYVEHKTVCEVARETGAAQQSIDRSLRRLGVTIKNRLAELGLSDSEINELLSQTGRCRNDPHHR